MSLSLEGNNIGAEGAETLLNAYLDLGPNRQLRYLNVRENGEIGLPKEVLETDDADALLAAYESFRRSAENRNLVASMRRSFSWSATKRSERLRL